MSDSIPAFYPLRVAVLPTPFGYGLQVGSRAGSIVASDFVRRTVMRTRITDPLLREAAAQAGAYFRKRLRRFDLPLQFEGTPFECSVWSFVAQMETGELISYADLSRILGKPRGARGVARAMSRSPFALFVPAHRVIGSDGTIRGAAPGAMRRKLLAFEGIHLK